jgi:opacity protein-like surface antigen
MAPYRAGFAALLIVFTVDVASAAELLPDNALPQAFTPEGWHGSFSYAAQNAPETSVCWEDPDMVQGPCGMTGELLAIDQLEQRHSIQASVGYGFANGFRLAGEISDWRRMFEETALAPLEDTALMDDDVPETALMLSGSYGFDTRSGLKPFLGAGIGGVQVDETAEGAAFSESESAWKLGLEGFAGLQYEFGPAMKIGLRYSHKLISKWSSESGDAAEIDDGEAPKLGSRALMVTFTYKFGAE